jgi:hypothetical protein
MATWLSLLDAAKMNADSMIRPVLDDTELALPELTNIMAEDIPGLEFKSLVYKSPLVMRYKKHGAGVAAQKSTPELQTFSCHYLPGLIQAPQSKVDGITGGLSRYLALEIKRMLSASFAHMARCLHYGTLIDADSPPGLIESCLAANVIDAGGSSGTTSVIAIRSGEMDVSWIFGQNGRMSSTNPTFGNLTADDGGLIPGWSQWVTGHVGHCLRSPRSIAMIENVDTTHGVTDEMLLDLCGKFKTSAPCTHIFMTKTAAIGYGKGRITDYNKNAQVPTNFGGLPGRSIPLLITDALDLDEDDGTTATELEAQTDGDSFVTP